MPEIVDFEDKKGKFDWKKRLDKHVTEFNKLFASVVIGDKHKIMKEVCDETTLWRKEYRFYPQETLAKLYQNTSIKVAEDKGHDVVRDHFTAWSRHPDSRCYMNGVIFQPCKHGQQLDIDGYFNTWRGFAVDPLPAEQIKKSKEIDQGDVELIIKHIGIVLCGMTEQACEMAMFNKSKAVFDFLQANAEPEDIESYKKNVDIFDYVMNWLAFTLQNPDKPALAALVLRGEKGSGKGTLGTFLMKLWGNHGLHISNAKHLTHNFNGHLANTCFLFADEAYFGGDKQHEGVLKALITEPVLMIEQKGVDAIQQPNYLKIMMATNSDWAVPASKDERRYCVLDVSSCRIGDKSYFDDLRYSCNRIEVQQQFLHMMLTRDIRGFHPGKIPETEALSEQRLHSLDSIGKWLFDSLEAGYFLGIGEDWEPEVKACDMSRSYFMWCDRMKIGEYGRQTETALGRYLSKIFLKKRTSRGVDYLLGFLEQAVESFEEFEKVKVSK